MTYPLLASTLGIIALILLLLALRIMLRRGWFVAWLKGTLAVLMVVVAAGVGLAAADLYSYHSLAKQTEIATLSIEQLGKQRYRVSVFLPEGETRDYELLGDLWQMDVRVLKWKGPFANLGLEPGYRLDRLSGRYLLLEDERDRERSLYELSKSNMGFDVWRLLHASGQQSWVEANYGAATYMPLRDGARFSIHLSGLGVMARPLNREAQGAVERWD